MWARKYLFFGGFLTVLVLFTDFVLLVLTPPTPLSLLTAVLISVLFIPLGVSTALDAFLWTFVEVYENGLTLPDWKLRHVLRGERERFIPFSSIRGAITNSRFDRAPNIALYVGDEEYLIDKRDVHDLQAFEQVLRVKVPRVWDTPPSDEELDATLTPPDEDRGSLTPR